MSGWNCRLSPLDFNLLTPTAYTVQDLCCYLVSPVNSFAATGMYEVSTQGEPEFLGKRGGVQGLGLCMRITTV